MNEEVAAGARAQQQQAAQIVNLTLKNQSVENRNTELQQKISALGTAQEQQTKQLEQLNRQAAAREQENVGLKEKLAELEGILKHQAGKIMAQEKVRSELAEEKTVVQQQAESQTLELARLRRETDQLRDEIRQLKTSSPVVPIAETDQPVPLQKSAAPAPLSESEAAALLRNAQQMERVFNYRGALENYSRLADARRTDMDALKGKARCLLRMGQPDPALAAARAAVTAAPADQSAQLLLGLALAGTKQFNEATRVLGPVVRQDPLNLEARNALGAAWLGLGDMAAARRELEAALRLNPRLRDTHFNLAQVFFFSKPPDVERARQHYKRALEMGATPDPQFEKLLGSGGP